MYSKALFCFSGAIGIVLAAEYTKYTNSKYIACAIFGYTCQRIWGEAKPYKEVAAVWFYLQPILYGNIGASVLFRVIRPEDAGKSIGIVLCGQVARYITVFLMSGIERGKYTVKERVFMGFSNMPKSSNVATNASVVLI
jgi:NhaP-type Na+/H+ or K+/H+ antiporter